MSKVSQRVLIVGASSLLGREIVEAAQDGPLASANIILLDSDAEPGKLEEIGGEAAVLQAVEPASFEGADAVIFATAADAGRFWGDVQSFGAAAVDATGTIQGLPVISPRLGAGLPLSLETSAVAAAHPVTTMLAGVLLPLQERGLLREAFATVLQPVSENGAAALDELHQQTVNLLSFQSVPTEQHDVQVAFNLLPRLGEDAKLDLTTTSKLVERQLTSLLQQTSVALQWVQAPVFHGYAVSLFVSTTQPVDRDMLQVVFPPDLFELLSDDDVPASNVSAAGGEKIQVEVKTGTSLRLWLVADNLKLLSQTAVGCAAELLRMRPSGIVQ